MHSEIQVSCTPPQVKTLHLRGDFDLAARAELCRKLDDVVGSGCVRLEVDGVAVTFIDSGCLRALDAARVRMEGLGRSLVVPRASAVFERMATLTDRRALLVQQVTSGTPPGPGSSGPTVLTTVRRRWG